MASRIYEIAFKIGGQIAASFPKSLSGASSQLQMVGKQIADMEKAQGTVTRFRDLHNQIDAAKQKLRQAESEFKHLGATVGPMTAEMARKFEALPAKIAKLRGEWAAQVSQLKGVKAAMEAAGVSARTLGADSDKLAAKLAKAQAQQKKVQGLMAAKDANQKSRDTARSKLDESKGKLLGAAAGVAAFAIPAKITAEFEDSMVRAGALAGANEEQYAKMTAQARQLGRDTRFSATQAAEGMQYLAQSGFKVEQIMQTMPGMLDIAGAGMVSIGEAADITSNILRGFGLRESETARLGDVLTNTFTSSGTTLESLGETMKYVGPVAKATGASLEMMAAAAGKLGTAGIKGGEAGTALRAMLLRLASPRAKGAKVLASMGVKTMDAKKNLLPFEQILANMAQKSAKMGSAAKAAMIDAVFGVESASAATVLLGEAGSGGLQKYAEALKTEGSAAKIAAKQNATMAGQWDNFKGSVEDVAIEVGTRLIPTLKSLIDKVVPIINSVTQWANEHPKLTEAIVLGGVALASMNALLVAGGLAWNGIQVAMVAAKGAMIAGQIATAAMNTQLMATMATCGLWVVAIGLLVAAGYLWAKNWDEITDGFVMAWNSVRNAVVDTVDFIRKIDLYEEGKRLVKSLTDGILSWGDIPTKAMATVVGKIKGIFTDKKAEEDAKIVAALQGKVRFTDIPSTLPSDITSNANVGRFDYSSQPAPSLADRAANMSPAPARGGDITLHYSPKIEVSGGSGPEVRSAVEKATSEGHRDLEKKMKELLAQGRRVAFE